MAVFENSNTDFDDFQNDLFLEQEQEEMAVITRSQLLLLVIGITRLLFTMHNAKFM